MTDQFGIWCNGWCHIKGYDPSGSHYYGTREQAEAALPQYKNASPAGTYEVVPFDPSRDPKFIDGKPSIAQLRALQLIDKYKSWNTWPRIAGVTMDALLRRGQGCRLTAGGARLLAAAKEEGCTPAKR